MRSSQLAVRRSNQCRSRTVLGSIPASSDTLESEGAADETVLESVLQYVFGPPGSGSGSGSVGHKYGFGPGFFHHQEKIVRKTLKKKIVRKTLIPTGLGLSCNFFFIFEYLG
jgi:hypothetical protein